MRADDEILRLKQQRVTQFADAHQRMNELADIVEGRKTVPLPELAKNEKPAVPNLIGQALDQMSQRIASTMPMVRFYPSSPGKKASEKNAATRENVVRSWWEANFLSLHMRKRAKHLLAFGMTPSVLRYDAKMQMPRWEMRDPRDMFPGKVTGPNPMAPDDVVFRFMKPWYWLLQNYPEKIQYLRVGEKPKLDDLFEIVEYVDGYCHKLIVVGKAQDQNSFYSPDRGSYGANNFVCLEETVHDLGMCPVVVGTRITLDRIQGAYDLVSGMYERLARIMALQEIAIERGIFAEPWLEGSDPNTTPAIITPADGKEGIVGIVKGGRINWERPPADFAVNNLAANLERNIRVSASIPAEWGGESASNVRTGRRGDAIMSAAVDFEIQEAQEILQVSMFEENLRAIALDKKYSRGRKVIPFSVKRAGTAHKDYEAKELWSVDRNDVHNAINGADSQTLNIMLAQKVGTGLMSRDTAMKLDPMVPDQPQERQNLIAQRVDDAALSALEQQVAAGEIPLIDAAAIKKAILAGESWEDAVVKAQEAAQERQATQVAPTAPEAQPGLSMAGMGAEASPAIPPASPSVENLAQVFSMNRRVNMDIPQERGPISA